MEPIRGIAGVSCKRDSEVERRANVILFFATIGVAAIVGAVVLAIRSYRGRPTVGV
jgi:hypothetical protein